MSLRDIPTVELHRHWEAGISPEVIATLAQRNGVKNFITTDLITKKEAVLNGVDPQSPESLQRYIDSVIESFRDPEEGMRNFLTAFRALNSVIRTEEDIEHAIFEQLNEEKAAGSLHTELRGSPLSITKRTNIPIHRVIEAVKDGIQHAWIELEMSATPIFCFSREVGLAKPEKPFEYQAPAVIDAVVKHHLPHFPLGIDIAGNDELEHPPSKFHDVFAPAREAGVPITVHAGEQGIPPKFEKSPADLIRQALALGATRIGHGTAAISDTDLLDEVRDRHIGIETCPRSNDLMGYMPLGEHPLRKLLDSDILATVCTDDPIFFGVKSVRDMLGKYAGVLGLNEKDQWKLARNGVETAFVSDERRRLLKGKLADHERMRRR